MNHFNILLFIIALFLPTFLKAEEIIYFPVKNSSSVGSVVATGQYTDLRADLDSDGKIDYWLLKKKNISIEQFYKAGIVTLLKIEQISGNSIREIVYLREGNILKLYKAVDRFPQVFGYSSVILKGKSVDICEKQKNVVEELAKIGGDLEKSVCAENLDSKGIVDSSCNGKEAVISNYQYQNIARGWISSLDTSSDNTFLQCLEDPQTSEILGKTVDAKKRADIAQELKLISLKYKLYAAQFYKNPESLKGKITCKVSPTKGPVAQTIEKKFFIFYKRDEQDDTPYDKVSTHEILHDLNLTDETSTRAIMDVCVEKKSKTSKEFAEFLKREKAVGSTFANLNNAASASKTQAQTTAAKVPKQLAETAIQNPPVAQLNQPFTESKQALAEVAQAPEAAATKALGRSVSQSRGVFSTANNLLNTFGGAPQAVAAETAASSISATGGGVGSSGSSRSPASSKSSSRSRATNKDDDYKVVEEILVNPPTANNEAAAKALPSGSAANFNPENGSANSSAAKAKAANSRETASGGGGGIAASSGSSSGTDNGFRPAAPVSSGGSGSSGSSSRSPASETQRKSGASSANSLVSMNRQDIIGAFTTRSSYSALKKQITQSDVQQKLRANSISIFDTKGNVIGAPRGQTIFLDSGDAFVRQK